MLSSVLFALVFGEYLSNGQVCLDHPLSRTLGWLYLYSIMKLDALTILWRSQPWEKSAGQTNMGGRGGGRLD